MKYVGDALRMVFISLEFVFVLAVYVATQIQPRFLQFLGDSIAGNVEVTKWLPAIPLALSGGCFVTIIWKIITPLNGSNRELYDWPGYWRLRMRCYFSLILSAICATVAVSIWIFVKVIPTEWIGILFLTSLGVALITVGSMAFASFAIRVIMEPKSD
jgi:hypothetical protein